MNSIWALLVWRHHEGGLGGEDSDDEDSEGEDFEEYGSEAEALEFI